MSNLALSLEPQHQPIKLFSVFTNLYSMLIFLFLNFLNRSYIGKNVSQTADEEAALFALSFSSVCPSITYLVSKQHVHCSL